MQINLPPRSRGLLVGPSGSGKTALGLELVLGLPPPVLVLDTKWAASIQEWAVLYDFPIVHEMPDMRRVQGVVIYRPEPELLAEPAALDAQLNELVLNHDICSVYIDELYQLHKSGRAGPGIVGLWTRGREMGFTTLAATQRPAWISAFCLTESDYFYVFNIRSLDDRKKLCQSLGNEEYMQGDLKKYHFRFSKIGERSLVCAPIHITKPALTPIEISDTKEVELERRGPRLIR